MKTAHVSMIPARTLRCVFVGLFLAAVPMPVVAQPGPGDLFREYRWTNEHGDCGGACVSAANWTTVGVQFKSRLTSILTTRHA